MVLKVYRCLPEQIDVILAAVIRDGFALLAETTSIVNYFYDNCIQGKTDGKIFVSFTLHPKEGCFYYLYDTDRYLDKQVKNKIFKATFDFLPLIC